MKIRLSGAVRARRRVPGRACDLRACAWIWVRGARRAVQGPPPLAIRFERVVAIDNLVARSTALRLAIRPRRLGNDRPRRRASAASACSTPPSIAASTGRSARSPTAASTGGSCAMTLPGRATLAGSCVRFSARSPPGLFDTAAALRALPAEAAPKPAGRIGSPPFLPPRARSPRRVRPAGRSIVSNPMLQREVIRLGTAP